MRKLPAILVTAGLLVSLSACATASGPFSDCTPNGNAGLVSAPGSFDSDPKAEFPTPLVATSTDVSVLVQGDGDAISSTDVIEATASIYSGDTGDVLASQQGEILALSLRSAVKGDFPFVAALTCATTGSRVVTTGTALQLFGEAALGLDPATTLVVVADITASYPAKATGVDQIVGNEFPGVVMSPIGEPGLTFGSKPAPTALTIAVSKQGNGATVAAGDTLALNLVGIVWGGKVTFASSWSNSAPVTVIAAPLDASGQGVVSGLAKALVGQRVGSQIFVIVPPSDGYPAGAEPAGVSAGDTLFFVVDILAID
ncbi:MAG: FKBP-type peptidyl-prolyl cis-trans isomerase [Rhodoglobus sp.]